MRAIFFCLSTLLLLISPAAAGKDYEVARLMEREGKVGEAVKSARACYSPAASARPSSYAFAITFSFSRISPGSLALPYT